MHVSSMRVYYVERSNRVRAISVIDPPHWFYPRSNTKRSRSNTTCTSKCVTTSSCGSRLSVQRRELQDFGEDRANESLDRSSPTNHRIYSCSISHRREITAETREPASESKIFISCRWFAECFSLKFGLRRGCRVSGRLSWRIANFRSMITTIQVYRIVRGVEDLFWEIAERIRIYVQKCSCNTLDYFSFSLLWKISELFGIEEFRSQLLRHINIWKIYTYYATHVIINVKPLYSRAWKN